MNGLAASLARFSPALRHFCRFEKKPNDPRMMRAAARGYEMQSISARSRASSLTPWNVLQRTPPRVGLDAIGLIGFAERPAPDSNHRK